MAVALRGGIYEGSLSIPLLSQTRTSLLVLVGERGDVLCVLCVQVEETTREREERLKGWNTFLEGKGKEENGGNEVKDGSNGDRTGEHTAGEHTVPSGDGRGEPLEAPESSMCAAGPEGPEGPEEVHSTDSSIAGSDEDDT